MVKGTGLNGPTMAIDGNLHTFMNKFLGKKNAPTTSLNEPSTSNELHATLLLMNDIQQLESLMLWKQLKNIILNRQQYRILEEIINIRNVTHPAYEKQQKIFFKIKEDLEKVRMDIAILYFSINPSYSKKDYLNYIITISHIIENTYVLPLNFYQYNIEQGLTPYNFFMTHLYNNYHNEDEVFPFRKIEHKQKSAKERIMAMIENMEKMSKHYKKDIDAINNDNMTLLFKTIQTHLSEKQELARLNKERKEQHALKKAEVQPTNNRTTRRSTKIGPIALRKLKEQNEYQTRKFRLSKTSNNFDKPNSPRRSLSPKKANIPQIESSPQRQATPEREKLLRAIRDIEPRRTPTPSRRAPSPRRPSSPNRQTIQSIQGKPKPRRLIIKS
jgi:hypothetical protein